MAYQGRGEGRKGGLEVGEEGEYIPIATLSPPERLCIKRGSDQSHFNVSLIGRDKVTRQCPQITTFKTVSTDHNLFEEKGELKRIRTEVPLFYR